MLQECQHIVVGFDGSLNKISQKQQMDVVVRYWNNSEKEVKTKYFSSVFLQSTKASDLKKGLIEAVGESNLSTIVQISMDGPAVNFSMLKQLKLSFLKTILLKVFYLT